MDGIQVAVLPNSLHIDQVKFVGLTNTVVLGPDRRPTFLALLRNPPGATNAANAATNLVAAAPAPAASPMIFPITIGACVVVDAAIRYLDDYIEPHAGFGVQQFSGSISNISSDKTTTATVALQGKVDDRAPFSITGSVNPFVTNMDMTVVFTNTELTPLSTYSEKYVGRSLEKGKLSFAVHTVISNGVITLANGFYVDQLTLGPKNDSPDATHLPVKLAVDLLKDRNGVIDLSIPVTGRVNDPNFSVGPAIWHVVGTLLAKAATSPFSLLGAAFGGGDELSFVGFEPGQSAVPDGETNKLEKLAKALYAHPALSLDISGSVDTNLDRLPLAHHRLEEQLKALWVKEQQDAGKPAVALEQVNLDPAEREHLLRKLYKTRIGSYQPSLAGTNAAGGTNSETARLAALLAHQAPESRIEHGDSQLRESAQTASRAAEKSSAAIQAQAVPAVPLTPAQLQLEDMEDQLAEGIEITPDDFRALMQKRADRVQAYLSQTGKVSGERLFIIPPKTVDESFQGADRVNLSLE